MMDSQKRQTNGIIIGLTGNIASGKSTVGKILEEMGATVVDADQVARQVVAIGTPALHDLVNTFGEKILKCDGSLNREVLGNMVFGNNEALEKLNKITHPRIRNVLQQMFDEFRRQSKPGVLVVEAALLFETSLNLLMDQVWFVTAPLDTRIKRLMMRNGLSYEAAMKRINSQESEYIKLVKSDFVINNDGDQQQLYRMISEVYQKIVKN